MGHRYRTLVRTGQRASISMEECARLFGVARRLCPQGFPADETRMLDAVRAHVTLDFVDRLRGDLARELSLEEGVLSLDRFSIQGCGPVSLHDDKRNYPDYYFIIVVVHGGELGLVDAKCIAAAHLPGEIILLDPHKKHGAVPLGKRGVDQRCAPPDTYASDAREQFMFLDFEVPRQSLRSAFAEPN